MRRPRNLSKMKRLEIVVEPERVDALVELIGAHATGYTITPGVTGLGEHGLREHGMVVLVTIVTPDDLDEIIEIILPSLSERANVVCINDVHVLRAEHFIPEVRTASRAAKA